MRQSGLGLPAARHVRAPQRQRKGTALTIALTGQAENGQDARQDRGAGTSRAAFSLQRLVPTTPGARVSPSAGGRKASGAPFRNTDDRVVTKRDGSRLHKAHLQSRARGHRRRSYDAESTARRMVGQHERPQEPWNPGFLKPDSALSTADPGTGLLADARSEPVNAPLSDSSHGCLQAAGKAPVHACALTEAAPKDHNPGQRA